MAITDILTVLKEAFPYLKLRRPYREYLNGFEPSSRELLDPFIALGEFEIFTTQHETNRMANDVVLRHIPRLSPDDALRHQSRSISNPFGAFYVTIQSLLSSCAKKKRISRGSLRLSKGT